MFFPSCNIKVLFFVTTWCKCPKQQAFCQRLSVLIGSLRAWSLANSAQWHRCRVGGCYWEALALPDNKAFWGCVSLEPCNTWLWCVIFSKMWHLLLICLKNSFHSFHCYHLELKYLVDLLFKNLESRCFQQVQTYLLVFTNWMIHFTLVWSIQRQFMVTRACQAPLCETCDVFQVFLLCAKEIEIEIVIFR